MAAQLKDIYTKDFLLDFSKKSTIGIPCFSSSRLYRFDYG
ncbi:hypothetical protein KP77_04230 [Jeotgalibacillus alimentarius]|uniref:Uncharacterized protein n=1 Tax=Jeotgalibacillus alimentarius TaxID=135826 RepID=A0A0C2VX68_9BACL|nr:hypothetical protein KP77_04230 [Jeotgalibacillus alimentarius]